MGPLAVVVVAEVVELVLERGQCGRWGLAGEPALEGLVEALDFAAGLGVVGPGVAEVDPSGVQGDLEDDPAGASVAAGEDRAVVCEQRGRSP